MIPSHIPFIVSMICLECDTMLVQNLIKTNLGPLLNIKDYIECSRTNIDAIECNVYASWKLSRACCQQLQETFTSYTLHDIIDHEVSNITVDCELPNRYT